MICSSIFSFFSRVFAFDDEDEPIGALSKLHEPFYQSDPPNLPVTPMFSSSAQDSLDVSQHSEPTGAIKNSVQIMCKGTRTPEVNNLAYQALDSPPAHTTHEHSSDTCNYHLQPAGYGVATFPYGCTHTPGGCFEEVTKSRSALRALTNTDTPHSYNLVEKSAPVIREHDKSHDHTPSPTQSASWDQLATQVRPRMLNFAVGATLSKPVPIGPLLESPLPPEPFAPYSSEASHFLQSHLPPGQPPQLSLFTSGPLSANTAQDDILGELLNGDVINLKRSTSGITPPSNSAEFVYQLDSPDLSSAVGNSPHHLQNSAHLHAHETNSAVVRSFVDTVPLKFRSFFSNDSPSSTTFHTHFTPHKRRSPPVTHESSIQSNPRQEVFYEDRQVEDDTQNTSVALIKSPPQSLLVINPDYKLQLNQPRQSTFNTNTKIPSRLPHAVVCRPTQLKYTSHFL